MSRNVVSQAANERCVLSQKRRELIYAAVDVTNHSCALFDEIGVYDNNVGPVAQSV